MFRAPDPWDLPAQKPQVYNLGFAKGVSDKYDLEGGKLLGKGGFGSVRIVTNKSSKVEYACKSISKTLEIPNLPAVKQQQHLDNIKREVSVLRKLRGTLNVIFLEDVYEDDTHVHIVMELCKGGELLQRIGKTFYGERTVASYMRAVLRTLAQCHHHRILHRDIKPGNFMLLSDAEDAPVKAIDFGLAVLYNPKELPLKDLGLEGTPHYMAPEMLSSEVYPVSDVWAAGVMCYQLLSGKFPFDDWKNLRSPALSQLWKSILADEPKFSGAAWAEVSDDAKDFIRLLLTKDPKQRPTAKQALEHHWVQGRVAQRREGKPLASTIVQRLQRYSAENAFKRTILDMITNELLVKHMRTTLAANIPKKPEVSPVKADAEPGLSKQQVNDPQLRAMAARSIITNVASKCPTVHGPMGSSAYALLSQFKQPPSTTRTSFDADGRPLVALGGSTGASPMAIPGAGRGSGGLSSAGAMVGSLGDRSSLPVGSLPHRKTMEGSGHALQHYAFLLAAGERSVNNMRRGTGSGGSVHGPSGTSLGTPGQAPGLVCPLPPTAAPGTSPGFQLPMRASAEMPVVGGPAPMSSSPHSRPPLVGGSLHRSDNMLKLLGSVQRQRAEHRKLQRLILDTSGRAQTNFAGHAGAPNLETVKETDKAMTGPSRRSSESGSSFGSGGEEEGEERKGLLQKVGKALLKPVEKLIRAASAADGNASSGPGSKGDTGVVASGAETPNIARASVGLAAMLESHAQSKDNDLEENMAARRNLEEGGRGRGAAFAALFGGAAPPAAASGASASGPAPSGSSLAAMAAAATASGVATQVSGPLGAGALGSAFAAPAAAAAAVAGANGGAATTAAQPAGGSTGSNGSAAEAAKPVPLDNDVLQPAGDMFAIRTVKAHKQPSQQAAPAPEPEPGNIIAAQLAKLEPNHSVSSAAGQDHTNSGTTRTEGTVSKGMLYNVLGTLMGGPAQVAEFEAVLQKLQYDKNTELTFEQISEGLQWLGYKLEASEVEVLLREVALGDSNALSQSAFLASQVDWREFQANHREEWLDCLQSAFAGLDKNGDGRISAEEIVGLLRDKLPEEEVNLAVQETLMDAALGSEGLDFDDFARLLRADSMSDLGSQGSDSVHGGNENRFDFRRAESMDLYDSRYHPVEVAAAGTALSPQGSGHGVADRPGSGGGAGSAPGAGHQQAGSIAGQAVMGASGIMAHHMGHYFYQPQLPTVPDSDED